MSQYSEEQVYQKIREIISELFEIPQEEILMESKIADDLDLDSIDAVDLIVKLQELVGKRFDPEQFKSVRTIADVVKTSQAVLTNSDIVVRDELH